MKSILLIVVLLVGCAEVCVKNQCVNVEVAETLEEKQTGLKGREKLDGGMLFVMEGDEGFWMKDMQFSVDAIWIENSTISEIKHRALPCKEDCEVFSYPGDYVLVLNAGEADDLGLKQGDKVAIHD